MPSPLVTQEKKILRGFTPMEVGQLVGLSIKSATLRSNANEKQDDLDMAMDYLGFLQEYIKFLRDYTTT